MSGTADVQTKRSWVEQVLAFRFPDAAETTAAVNPDDPEARLELKSRVQDLVAQGNLLPEAFRADFLGQAQSVAAMVDDEDLEFLLDEVEALEDARTQAGKAANIADAVQSIKGTVQYRKMQLAWRDAQNMAAAGLDRFIATVLADPDIQNDELRDQVVEATDNASALVPQFGGELADLLDRLDVTIDPAQREALTRQANQVIDDYAAELEASEGLRELQRIADDEYSGISFFSELQAALRSMRAAIA